VTIESGLRALIMGDATVGAAVAARVFPSPAPQNSVYPFITFQRISGQRVRSLAGPSRVALPVFQIDVWADSREQLQGGNSYMASRAIADAVRHALDGYSGRIEGYAVTIIFQDERDLVEDEPRITRVSMDFRIWHEEA
jgi:hypothetical protein